MPRAKNDAVLEQKAENLDRRLGDWSVTILVLLGLWILLGPLVPEVSGHAFLGELMGGPEAVNRFFLGFLFLYFAGIVKEKNHLRQTLRGMVAVIKRQLEGRTVTSIKEAVDILVRGLEKGPIDTRVKAAKRLAELTGEDFGDDAEAWRSWWKAHRESFRPPGEGG